MTKEPLLPRTWYDDIGYSKRQIMQTLSTHTQSSLDFLQEVDANAVHRLMLFGSARMYAIAFDMDTDTLSKTYGNDSYNNAYADIKKVLPKHGFLWKQGSVYFGDPEKVNAVTCVLAIMEVTRTYPWFAPSVRDVRMLRIEEQNDLMGAVKEAILD